MRKIVLILALASCLTSCMTQKHYPIKGQYPFHQNERLTDITVEQAWSNSIDFFADNGLSIKLIDKSSGLIISERTNFIRHFSYENKDNRLRSPEAYVVLEEVEAAAPREITGDWNVRIKEVNGKASVKVNLVNILALSYNNGVYDAKSTGNFEKIMLDRIEHK